MMRRLLILASFLAAPWGFAEEKKYEPAAILEVEELAEFAGLSEARQDLLRTAMETAEKASPNPYLFGGNDPSEGFDCSGAMYFVLRKEGYKPPRTSAQQFVWIRDAGEMHPVGEKVESLEDEIFEKLKPGDLLFWSGTYVPTDGRTVKVTHVAMYAGTEKKDGRRVMISSTEGRSYRRVQSSGMGVQDFRLPSKTSRSKFVGFGSIPGIEKEE